MLRFGQALPQLRARVDTDLSQQGLPREKVLATVVYLLEHTLIRVGNTTYARENNSFGLTTLQDEHVNIRGGTMVFEFRGKSNKDHTISFQDKRIAQVVKKCRDLPGQALFQYLDDHNQRATIDSGDVNEYLNTVMGDTFTAKDFRTWAGTVHALLALEEAGPFATIAEARRNVQQAVTRVSQRLGNTPAICRSSYIHPAVLQLYLEGVLFERLQAAAEAAEQKGIPGLAPEEARVIPLLASAAAVTAPKAAKKQRRPNHQGNRRAARRQGR